MVFELRALPAPTEKETAFWFAFEGDKMLVEIREGTAFIPFSQELPRFNLNVGNCSYLGRLDSHPCYMGEASNVATEHEGWQLIGLRQLYGMLEEEIFWLAARAYHLVNWYRSNVFCGRCGAATLFKPGEHSKYCPNCNQSSYPRISPAVIVAITNEDKILLAQNVNSKGRFYSVLAGFVEPGEDLEGCVRREVREEAGIELKNIQYFGSQPWPFPDSLMVGFTAEYAGGEIRLDPMELCDAGWYTADQLPAIPGKMSISRKLIQWFIDRSKKQGE